MADAKYEIIIRDIKRMIGEGQFTPGDKIYSEGELKRCYNVSSTTVVRALHELAQEGWLMRIQGKGTYVNKALFKTRVIFNEYNQFHTTGSPQQRNYVNNTSSIVTQVKEINNAEICQKLSIAAHTPLIQFQRLRFLDNVPCAVQNNYIDKNRLPGFEIKNIERFTVLSDFIKKTYAIDVLNSGMKEKISVIFPLQDSIIKKLLTINEPFPVYRVERITYLPDSTAFEYVESFIRYDCYHIEIEKEKQ